MCRFNIIQYTVSQYSMSRSRLSSVWIRHNSSLGSTFPWTYQPVDVCLLASSAQVRQEVSLEADPGGRPGIHGGTHVIQPLPETVVRQLHPPAVIEQHTTQLQEETQGLNAIFFAVRDRLLLSLLQLIYIGGHGLWYRLGFGLQT